MKNIKILPKFIILMTPVILLVIGLLVTIKILPDNLTDNVETALYDELYVSSTNLINADRDYYQAYLAAVLCTIDGEDVEAQLADLDENYNQVKERVQNAIDAISGNEELYTGSTLASLNGEVTDDKLANMTIKELSEEFNTVVDQWYNSNDEEGPQLFELSRDYLNSMEDILDLYASKELADITENKDNTIRTVIIISAAIVVCVAAFILIVLMELVKGVSKVEKNLKRLSDNDLAFEPENVKGKDEIGNMSSAAIQLKTSLADAIGKVNYSAEALSDRIVAVSDGIERSVSGVNNINVAVGEVADTSQQVATSAQELNIQAIEMGDTIESISDSIENLKNASAQIDTINKEAANGMNSVMKSSQMSADAVKEITEKINETNSAVDRISECINVISSISAQTNLLSLNASIEAARAGEAGKGFAVVADEIRALADSTASSAGEINEIVNTVMEISEQTVEAAKKIAVVIEEEQKSVKDTQGKFDALSTSVEESIDSINNIQTMSKGLDEIKNKLADATSTLSSISEELGASAEEVSATCTQVAGDCETANTLSKEMSDVKEELEEAVGVFKI